jgi:type VI secretion system secreted protein VgrG
MGDMTVHGGTIVIGCPTVLIGEVGSAGGGGGGGGGGAFGGVPGPQVAAMSAAKKAGSAFLETGCEAKAAIAAITAPTKFENATRSAAENKPDPQKTWVELEVAYADGAPMALEYYRVDAPGGVTREGWTDEKGKLRLEGLDPGDCKITFPDIEEAVRKATAGDADR